MRVHLTFPGTFPFAPFFVSFFSFSTNLKDLWPKKQTVKKKNASRWFFHEWATRVLVSVESSTDTVPVSVLSPVFYSNTCTWISIMWLWWYFSTISCHLSALSVFLDYTTTYLSWVLPWTGTNSSDKAPSSCHEIQFWRLSPQSPSLLYFETRRFVTMPMSIKFILTWSRRTCLCRVMNS